MSTSVLVLSIALGTVGCAAGDEAVGEPDEATGSVSQAVVTGSMLYNKRFAQCADVANWSVNDNAPVNRFTCHRGANQLWELRSNFVPALPTSPIFMRNVNSQRCLDRPWGNTASGTPLQQYRCHGGPEQEWIAEGTVIRGRTWYRFRAPGTEQCLFALADQVRLTMSRCRPEWDSQYDAQLFALVAPNAVFPPP